ncbi:MAG: ATP-dependent RNA helicase DeaD [Glaciecola sp.]|jgi:ATP-dependent RNA helicase DeaD
MSSPPAESTDATDASKAESANFSDLALRPELLAELVTLGYEEPTPIQLAAIPPALERRDILGQAATGTGKTAAFALPLLNQLAVSTSERGTGRGRPPMALVLVPTRELAMQVSQAVHRYGRGLQAQALPVYGGQPVWRQLKELERGVDVVVGTPGRVLDHLKRGSLKLDLIEVVVLDEADEMLDMGFTEDLEAILSQAPDLRQTMLFSATMPGRINKMANRHLNEPVRISIGRDATAPGVAPLIRQAAYAVQRSHKPAALGRVLDVEAPEAAIIFCGTRHEVDSLTEIMSGRGYRAEALHGGMTQEQRDRVMDRLRNQTAELLVATDVAARGLDIDHLTHVVNYDVPSAPESYTHRIGRVGRAGREGVAITLVEPRQIRLLEAIERHTKTKLPLEQVPSVAALKSRRRDLAQDALREVLEAGDLDDAKAIIEGLTGDFHLEQIALAAVTLANRTVAGTDEEVHLPEVHMKGGGGGGGYKGNKGGGKPFDSHTGGNGGGSGYQGKNPRSSGGGYQGKNPDNRDSGGYQGKNPDNRDSGGYQGKDDRSGSGDSAPRKSSQDMASIWVGMGKNGGLRPADLVGAIANETSLSGRDIGSIDIAPNFALVDVPRESANEVIEALRATRIKGKRAPIREDRAEASKKRR